MKKVLLIIILILFSLEGCSNGSNNTIKNEEDTMQNIYITEIEWCGIEWEKIQFAIDLKEIDIWEEIESIETNQIAIDFATTIIEECHEQGRFSDYKLISIIHSTKDNVWCFEYSIDQRDKEAEKLVDCGCLYVAIDGNKGALIKAWVEE